jgi:hypothetical protein
MNYRGGLVHCLANSEHSATLIKCSGGFLALAQYVNLNDHNIPVNLEHLDMNQNKEGIPISQSLIFQRGANPKLNYNLKANGNVLPSSHIPRPLIDSTPGNLTEMLSFMRMRKEENFCERKTALRSFTSSWGNLNS